MELDPLAAARGTRVVACDVVGSTNTEALALARAGEAGPLWITAHEQTGGRGRRGRSWHSPPGNLYASLLLTDACLPASAPQLSFVGALALHDCLTSIEEGLRSRLRLKWPNDVLLDGAKLAGILVEGETLHDGAFATVLGFGLNCAHHPADTAYPACDLASAGFGVTPVRAFTALSRTMSDRLAAWSRGENFAAIRNAWLARAAGLGASVCVHAPAGDLEGRFLSLDEAGRLVLELPGGATQAISAAEVFPVTAPSAQHLRAGEPA